MHGIAQKRTHLNVCHRKSQLVKRAKRPAGEGGGCEDGAGWAFIGGTMPEAKRRGSNFFTHGFDVRDVR